MGPKEHEAKSFHVFNLLRDRKEFENAPKKTLHVKIEKKYKKTNPKKAQEQS